MWNTQRRDRRKRRQAEPTFDALDDRRLLSGGAPSAAVAALVHDQPSVHAQRDHRVSPPAAHRDRSPVALPANVSAPLRVLYREYEAELRESRSSSSVPSAKLVSVDSSRVAVRIKVAFPPALGAYVRELRADGLPVISTVPNFGLVEGTLPIAKLPAVARISAHVWLASLPIQH